MEKPRAYICIDASNLHYTLKKEGWKIDWLKFKNHYESVFKDPSFYYYEGLVSKGCYFDYHPKGNVQDFNNEKKKKQKFFKFLRLNGYNVRQKPVARIYDNTSGQFKHKCNFDVELTIDAIDNMDKYDVFSLVSGDGDFEKLIKYLKGKAKKTIVIAPKERLSGKLEKAANVVITLNQIKNDIKY